MSKKVGLFFGSSTGITEYIAEEIAAAWQNKGLDPIEPQNIGNVKSLDELLKYDYFIIGVSTWNIGQLQDDWDIIFPQFENVDFSGKTVAMFGAGDQYGYPENFLDAIGILGDKFLERGADMVGFWNDGKYEFVESLAFIEDVFMGLGIDDTNQSDLNDQRINGWVTQVIEELALQPAN